MKKKLWNLSSVCLIALSIFLPCCDNDNKTSSVVATSIATTSTVPDEPQNRMPDVLIPVPQNMKWGFIDSTGKWVIKPQFDDARPQFDDWGFNDGLSPANIGARPVEYNGSYYIDFIVGGKWGFIDKTGTWVINPQFDYVDVFKDGLAPACSGGKSSDSGGTVGGKWGFIDKTGTWVIKPQFDQMSVLNGDLAPACSGGKSRDSGLIVGSKWGFIDKTGTWVIKPQFDQAKEFNDGLAPARIEAKLDRYLIGGKWGFIDKTGTWVIKPQFNDAGSFKDGLAPACIEGKPNFIGDIEGGKWGFIDKTGTWVIKPQFDQAKEFNDGLASAKSPNEPGVYLGNKWGFIDKTGTWIINPQFDYVSVFKNGLAAAAIGESTGRSYGVINKAGKWLINPQFDKHPTFVNGFIIGSLKEKYTVFDNAGEIIWNDGIVKKNSLQTKTKNTSGSGFYVSDDGHIITNHHVVDNAKEIKISGQHAELLSQDASNDLALLKVSIKPSAVATFRKEAVAKIGEDILTFGFPLTGLLSPTGSLTAGTVNALSGISNNVSHMQISIPVQPGNSGGPILDRKGHIIGVVVGKLNERIVNMLTGHLPENVNFAINAATVKAFLEINNVPYQKSGWFSFNKTNEEIGAEAQKFTVKVECTK